MLENFDGMLEEARTARPAPARMLRRFRSRNEAMLRSARALRSSGAEPLFILTPSLRWADVLVTFEAFHARRRPEIPLLSYLADLRLLDDPSKWSDPGHMTGEGAAIFSRRLGRDFAAWVKGVKAVEARKGR